MTLVEVFHTSILHYITLQANTLTAATKLLVHGIYTAITLCLYGSPAKPPEQGAEPPPLPKLLPPPPADCKPPLPAAPTEPSEVTSEPTKKQTPDSAEKVITPPPLPLTPSNTPDSKPVSKAKRTKQSRTEKRTSNEAQNTSVDKLSDYSVVRLDLTLE